MDFIWRPTFYCIIYIFRHLSRVRKKIRKLIFTINLNCSEHLHGNRFYLSSLFMETKQSPRIQHLFISHHSTGDHHYHSENRHESGRGRDRKVPD